ncbi:MAG: nitroreductase family protein [Oscillibacter sp.]|nr:nitroreductase family protein [Oscillibacter sp.]
MELTQAILSRRSVRQYQDRPVPREELEALLRAACWAPSAENAQPWYFVALTRPEDLRLLESTLERVSVEIRPQLEEAFSQYPQLVDMTSAFLRRLGGAPVCVLVFLQREYTGHSRDSMLESAAAAIQNLLLAAWERDIGSCWVNAVTETGYGPAIRQLFAPDKGELVSLVTLGYPLRKASSKPIRMKDRWVIR